MDKNRIKKFAIWARTELIMRVTQRAYYYGVDGESQANPDAGEVNGRLLTEDERRRRKKLVLKVQEKGFQNVMEEAAYTWFNRFAALRYMEVNGVLPTRVRVFSNREGAFAPQILDECLTMENLDGLDKSVLFDLKEKDATEDLYKYLLITQCNALGSILPVMFQQIEDYTELLLPDNLLREGSVIHQLVTEIEEDDWRDQVQIIGWLYQYYNSEPKDAVFAALKKNIKVSKENIPAATQLFTPDWIVRYMVENSLGRLWTEHKCAADDTKSEKELAEGYEWKYYLPEAEQEPEVAASLKELRESRKDLNPTEIKVIDKIIAELIQAHRARNTSKPYEIRGFEVFLHCIGETCIQVMDKDGDFGGFLLRGGCRTESAPFVRCRYLSKHHLQGVQNGHEGRN